VRNRKMLLFRLDFVLEDLEPFVDNEICVVLYPSLEACNGGVGKSNRQKLSASTLGTRQERDHRLKCCRKLPPHLAEISFSL
jgi:hypothetical protein